MHREEPFDDADQIPAVDGGNDHVRDLAVELGRLLDLAVAVVPTTIGVSLNLHGPASGLTVTALRPGQQDQRVLSSLCVRLPRPLSRPVHDGGVELVIYAGTAHAFSEAVPSLLVLLDVSSGNVTLDAHLEVPSLAAERAGLARWLDEQSIMDRAIGILLERGLLPDEGRVELARRAAAAGTSPVQVALSLIASTTAGRDPE